MPNKPSDFAKGFYQLNDKFYESIAQLDNDDIVDICLRLRQNRYSLANIYHTMRDYGVHIEDGTYIPEMRAISDYFFDELYKQLNEEAKPDRGPISITDRSDYCLQRYCNLKQMAEGFVILFNMTSKPIVFEHSVRAKPVSRSVYEMLYLYYAEGLEREFGSSSWEPQDRDFVFGELPKTDSDSCLLVKPEVAMQGTESNRPDLVAPLSRYVDLVNLTDSVVNVVVANGASSCLESTNMRVNGYFSPQPGPHPYLMMPLRDPDTLEAGGFYAVAQLPPEQEDRLLLVNWHIALAGHAMGRTDLIGVPRHMY